jgi:hypothetical protein
LSNDTQNPTNSAASVQARLLNISHAQGLDYNLMLKRYAMERLLNRLSLTPHADRFVLKGAMLFYAWGGSICDEPDERPLRYLGAIGDQGIFRESPFRCGAGYLRPARIFNFK